MKNEIKSRVYPDRVLHVVYILDDENDLSSQDITRVNLTSDDKYLQAARISLPKKGYVFRPHYHLHQTKETLTTHESWVVIRGKIRAILYDVDSQILDKIDLGAGDLVITFGGGHTYEVLEDRTEVYEFKTGPYNGQEKDKEFIKDYLYERSIKQ